MRFIAVFLGSVAVVVGVAGLFAPVSISPELRTVGCGNAVSPDLSEARAQDDGSAAQRESVIDIDYAELCRMDLRDRRILAATVAAGGAFILLVATGIGALQRSQRSTSER